MPGLVANAPPAMVSESVQPQPGRAFVAPGASSGAASFWVPVVHAASLFTVMRVTEAVLWPDPFADWRSAGSHYRDAFTKPPVFDASRPAFRWDGDSIAINVGGHGLMGSELYLRGRRCGFGWAESLGFAAGATAVWEYGFEANGVRPSAQDLIYTPVAGLLLGELRFALWRHATGANSWWRYPLDPLGELAQGLGAPC